MRRLLPLWLSIGALVDQAIALPSSGGPSDTVKVHWVGDAPESIAGTTFGLPWPQGKYHFNETEFTISGQSSGKIPLQSWVTGYWRDGSIKWTGHAIPSLDTVDEEYRVVAASSSRGPRSHNPSAGLTVKDTTDQVTVNTGKITVSFPKEGSSVVGSVKTAGGKVVGENGKLVLHTQSGVAEDVAARTDASIEYLNFESNIEEVSVSKENAARAVVTVRGKHQLTSAGSHDEWLSFVLRFYLYANSDAIRLVHSLVFDGKPASDFISGVGLQLQVPLEDEELYNRHVRIPGVDGGFLHEAVQGITGLRRDPGEEVRSAQYEGQETPDISTWDERVSSRMQWIPAWNDYKLSQLSPDGFTIKKRTKPGQGWINIPGGTRSGGLAYLGGATTGGLAVGLRDFWKKYPTGLDISNAGADKGQITLWLYSPEAAPLDLRPFHDGMGQDTYEKQLDALEITYEDYEPDFNTPYGIARTNEIFLYAFDQTPSSDNLAARSKSLNEPPVLSAKSEYIHKTKAIGSYWALPDTSNDKSATIENHLDFLVKYYEGQVESRRWYGFLDYGDFMHSYDEDRHMWRYDVGGYAWDNSELSPDLFFWQYFLHTGRADVYRLAEALTRHTGEVDVYHIGDWKGLGTRHGVQHFADSAKQARIAQPQYRKYFYYLSGGDERVGEILEETLDADKTYGILDPQRKVRTDGWTPSPGQRASVGLGTDWSGLAAGWLIEWERRGPRWQEALHKLTGTATGIANMKNGFVTGSGLYAITNATLAPPPSDPDNKGLVAVSHLDAVFGLPEVVSELLEYWGDDAPEGFRSAWMDYCYYYGASAEEQKARYGSAFSGISLLQGHSRLTAYWAQQRDNATVAQRAWEEFYGDDEGFAVDAPWNKTVIDGSNVVIPVEEASWVSTNALAQYGLAAIQNLAMIGETIVDSPVGKYCDDCDDRGKTLDTRVRLRHDGGPGQQFATLPPNLTMTIENGYDALVVGTGFGGIYQLYQLVQLGLSVKAIDKAGGPGGTWYWNRYPGTKSDSEAFVYRFSWDLEDLRTEKWSNRYVSQPEVLAYLEHVVDHHDLRKHMQFDTELLSAEYDETVNVWRVETTQGSYTARYLVTALGLLSNENWPNIPQRTRFNGDIFHTTSIPAEYRFKDKRVGIIGSGSTGVQIITALGPEVKHLTCFQRRPQYVVPCGDKPVTKKYRDNINQNYEKICDQTRESSAAMGFKEATISALQVSDKEREDIYQKAWDHRNGFYFMFGTFGNIVTNEDANHTATEFIRKKIEQIVKDPVKAQKLKPTELYGRRPLRNSGYYETFNRDNVDLVDAKAAPIMEFTPEGIRTADGIEYELDVVVCATGFNAVDGSLAKLNIRGCQGKSMKDQWSGNPSAYMGCVVSGFPNLFLVTGPKSPFANVPAVIEAMVELISGLIARAEKLRRIGNTSKTVVVETTDYAEEEWREICSRYVPTVFTKCESWFWGTNIEGKDRANPFYWGGIGGFRECLGQEVENNYEGFKPFLQ